MASTINEWKEIAEHHRTQLALAEAKIKELSPQLLTDDEMNKRVINLETRTAYKRSWKKNVVDYGLVHNVQSILDECRYYLCHPEEFYDHEKAKRVIGPGGSLQSQLFTLKVIEHLHKEGSFWRDGEFDSFEDTAGGCDEITEGAAIWVIEHSE